MKIANRSFENVSQFKYLGTTATDQNLIQEEIKRRLSLGNACYNFACGVAFRQNVGKHGLTSLCSFDLLLKLPSSSASNPLTLLGKSVYEDQDNLQDIVLKSTPVRKFECSKIST
jgi:hypothetical protein